MKTFLILFLFLPLSASWAQIKTDGNTTGFWTEDEWTEQEKKDATRKKAFGAGNFFSPTYKALEVIEESVVVSVNLRWPMCDSSPRNFQDLQTLYKYISDPLANSLSYLEEINNEASTQCKKLKTGNKWIDCLFSKSMAQKLKLLVNHLAFRAYYQNANPQMTNNDMTAMINFYNDLIKKVEEKPDEDH